MSTENTGEGLPQFTIHDADNCLAFIRDAAKKKTFELNLSSVDEIDTSGVQLLIALNKEAQACQKKLVIEHASAQVREIFELYNLTDSFIIN